MSRMFKLSVILVLVCTQLALFAGPAAASEQTPGKEIAAWKTRIWERIQEQAQREYEAEIARRVAMPTVDVGPNLVPYFISCEHPDGRLSIAFGERNIGTATAGDHISSILLVTWWWTGADPDDPGDGPYTKSWEHASEFDVSQLEPGQSVFVASRTFPTGDPTYFLGMYATIYADEELFSAGGYAYSLGETVEETNEHDNTVLIIPQPCPVKGSTDRPIVK